MRKIMSVLVFFLSVVFAVAEKSKVLVEQYVGPVGGEMVAIGVPVIPTENESIVEYQLKVVGKTNEHATVGCRIRFPNSFSVEPLNMTGIQRIENDSSTVPAMAVYSEGGFKYAEFLLPQMNDHVANVSFKITVPNEFAGQSVPINLNFDYMQKPFFKRFGTAIGIGCGVVAGVVATAVTLGNPVAGAAAGTAAGGGVTSALVGGAAVVKCFTATVGTVAGAGAVATAGTGIATAAIAGTAAMLGVGGMGTYLSYDVLAAKESLQEIRKKYDSTPMPNSNSVFYWIAK